MRYGILALFLLFFGPLQAQDRYPRDRGFDIQHYVFAIDVTQRPFIRIEERVDVLATEVDQIELDLVFDPAAGGGMKVNRVFGSNNLDIPYEQVNDKLRINLGKSDTLQQVFISIMGQPGDGLIVGTNKYGNRTIFGDNWPNRARHWLAAVDHPTEKATTEFIVQVEKGYQCVSNGKNVGYILNPDSSSLWFWKSEVPLPSKVMVIGVADFSIDTIGFLRDKPVTSWVYPEDSAGGHREYAAALPILQFFDSLIGPFPNEKLANVQSTTRYGGMENAGCIFYHEGSTKGDGSSENLIAHEIAHQWFGNSASEADWHHLWLSEGFATYFSYLYDEYKYGRKKLEERLASASAKVFAYEADYPRRAIIDTSIKNLNRLLNPLNYQKGAWVLHMMRETIGNDSLFFTGIRSYYQKFQLSNAYTEDFFKVMSEATGMDIGNAFRRWVQYPGHIQMSVEWYKKGDRLMLKHDIRGPQRYGIGPHRFSYKVGEEERFLDMPTDTYTNVESYPFPEEEPSEFKWVNPYRFLMEVDIVKASSKP